MKHAWRGSEGAEQEGGIRQEGGREERRICTSGANRSDEVKLGPGDVLLVHGQ